MDDRIADETPRYKNEEDDVMYFSDIAFRGAHGDAEVEEHEDGWLVDGDLYRPAENTK